MCETHVRASHHTRVGKPTRTVLDPKTVRERDRHLRERREADMGERQAKQYRLPIQASYETMIRDGQKTIEGRLARGNCTRIKAGDTLVLGSTHCRIKGVYSYWTFQEMLEACGLESVLPGCLSIAAGVQVYHGFPGFQAGEAIHGVVAIDLEVLPAEPPKSERAQPAKKKAPRKGSSADNGSSKSSSKSSKSSSSSESSSSAEDS